MEQPAVTSDPGIDLVRRAQAGDVDAFARLYRAHIDRVYALCLRMVADTTRAEVLAQDAFVRAWEALAGFRGDCAFGSWLHRIAVNTVLVDVRSRRRRADRIRAEEDLDALGWAAPPRAGAALDLEAAIAALPPQARHVLVLHDVEGYTHDEIGTLMGIAPGTSKAHLHRARHLLRAALER